MSEEAKCLQTLVQSLSQAVDTYCQRPKIFEGAPTEEIGTDHCLQFLDLLSSLLTSDPSPHRTFHLVFEACPSLISTLFAFVRAKLIYAPGITGRLETERALDKVIAGAITALTRIASLCAADDGDGSDRTENSADRQALSRRCAMAFASAEGPELLLSLATSEAADSVRVAAIECVFVLLMRVASGKEAVYSAGGLAHCVKVLGRTVGHGGPVNIRSEQNILSPLVRNYVAAIVRELAPDHAQDLINLRAPDVMVAVVQGSGSGDVRALALETLEVIFSRIPTYYLGHFSQKRELANVLRAKLERSGSDEEPCEVVESVCRLVETLAAIEARCVDWAKVAANPPLSADTFFTLFLESGGHFALLNCIRKAPRTACVAARAIRYFVQYSPPHMLVGRTLVQHFPALSALLKTALEDPEDARESGGAAAKVSLHRQVLRVEVAICVAAILAMDPVSRNHVHNELVAFPVWMAHLRAALLSSLANADVVYYADMDLVDCNGVLMNATDTIPWTADASGPGGDAGGRPDPSAIRALFLEQEYSANTVSGPVAPPLQAHQEPQSITAQLQERKAKLSFIILSYGVHITLSPASDDGTKPIMFGGPTSEKPTSLNVPVATPISAQAIPSAVQSAVPERPTTQPPELLRSRGPPRVWGASSEQVPSREEQRTPAWRHNSCAKDGPRSRPRYGPATFMRRDYAQHYEGPHPSYPSGRDTYALGEAAPYSAHPLNDYSQPDVPLDMPRKKTPYEHALALCVKFSRHYVRQRRLPKIQYRPTGDGLVVRASSLGYGAEAQIPQWAREARSRKLRSWSAADLRDGDLFDFNIPYDALSLQAIDVVINASKKHLLNAKKALLMTPSDGRARGRRCLLHDLLTNALPRIQDVLHDLRHLLDFHGVENVRFPILMFRSKELRAGETSVHPGNILEVISQLKFWFEQKPEDLTVANNEYIRKLDDKIRALKQKSFLDDAEYSSSDSSSDEDDEISARARLVDSTR